MAKLPEDILFSLSTSRNNLESFSRQCSEVVEEIANAHNDRVDSQSFSMIVSTTAREIPVTQLRGAGFIIVSGGEEGAPVLVAALASASSSTNGIISVVTQQTGTGTYSGHSYTLAWPSSSSPTLVASGGCPDHTVKIGWIIL